MKAVFVLRADPGQADEFIRRWEAASVLFQACPGAQGTKLHKSLEDDHVFFLLASWDSKASRDAAVEAIKDEPDFGRHEEVSTLLFDAEFEDPSIEIDPVHS